MVAFQNLLFNTELLNTAGSGCWAVNDRIQVLCWHSLISGADAGTL